MKRFFPRLVLLFSFCSSALFADAVVPPGAWSQNWSGQYAQVPPPTNEKTPDGESTLRWIWQGAPAGATPTVSSPAFAPQPITGDVAAFWLRVDHPVSGLNMILSDVTDVGAERSVLEMAGEKTLEPGHWYYAAWPYRVHPGWVRYAHSRVDWDHIRHLGFVTWDTQVHPELTVDIGPIHTLTFNELEAIFQKHPEQAGKIRSLSWQVLSDERADHMMDRYHIARATDAVEKLRQEYPPERFVQDQEAIRRRVAATCLMPEVKGPPEVTLIRHETIGGIDVELELLKIREGMYSTAAIYHPPAAPGSVPDKKYPAMMMLPGHGDALFAWSVQACGLSFAKQGYLVMTVEPFGQDQLGDAFGWQEGVESQSAAYLYPTGQSSLGIIMSNHKSELTYLLGRPDVDATHVVVTGVSMGGTHSIWFPAIDTRVTASVADAAAPFYWPVLSWNHMGMCDVMYGAYKVADQEMLYSLIAPRPLMEIIPGVQIPSTEEGMRLYDEGKISIPEMQKNYSCTPDQLTARHHYTHTVYDLLKAPWNYTHLVIPGPHAYTQEMREAASGFLAWAFTAHGQGTWKPIPEGSLGYIADHVKAAATFNFWPGGTRPPEILSPTAYTQRETSRLIAQLPPAPDTVSKWESLKADLQKEVRTCLGVELDSPGATVKAVGMARSEHGVIHKGIVSPEPGIEVPFLLFEPDDGVKSNGQLVVLLSPGGMTETSTDERMQLTAAGAWVMTVDLRGTGETRYAGESGGYLGFHDYDIGCMAIKLGNTLAGYWVKDLLAAIRAAGQLTGNKWKVAIHAQGETGLAAILAAGQSDLIDSVETKGLLASYYSPQGYGLPFAYSDDKNNKSVRYRALGGLGTMVPCIPNILKYADISQLAAMMAPRRLTISEPCWASGNPLSASEVENSFGWARQIYALCSAKDLLTTAAK